MNLSMKQRATLAILINLIALPAFFAFDIYFPRGVAGGVPYVAVVLVGLISRQPKMIIMMATASSVLTIAGYFFSPFSGLFQVAIVNRLLALFAIWSVAIISYIHLKELERLEPLATRDQLTKLFNRHYFTFEIVKQINFWRRHKQPLSILMLDIDHFKNINDTYGHMAGDYALQTIANICLLQVREIDTAARLGGEELAILLPSTDTEGALQMAERIRSDVEAYNFKYGKDEFKLTISVGITELTDETWSVTELLKAADELLYQAKASGRNVCKTGLVNQAA